jgi:hypothetical protein
MIHPSQLLIGVLTGPFIWVAVLLILHLLILRLRWFAKVVSGSPMRMWPLLWMVSYALPKLGKDYACFMQANGRQWVSPRTEKFRVLPRPEDSGQ